MCRQFAGSRTGWSARQRSASKSTELQAFTDYPANQTNFPTWFAVTVSFAYRFLDIVSGWILHRPLELLVALAGAAFAFHLIGAPRAIYCMRRGLNPLIAELDAE